MELLRKTLVEEARRIIRTDDPSHDIDHSLRVLGNAEYIARYEGGSLEIIIPAALFHDAANYPKDDLRANNSSKESATIARHVLETLPDYDSRKIVFVEKVILEHSYSAGIKPESLESKIVQDADRLEATGAIAIMRTFCSTGQMRRQFYNVADPFCEEREPNSLLYATDLFYTRLLRVKNSMNTETAKRLAEKRTRFLYTFLEQLREEITLGVPT